MLFKKVGVMGLNARDKYIRQYNSSQSIILANDKIYAREILQQNDIPVPCILGLMQSKTEIQQFNFNDLPKEFVVKPSQGSRGRGILVLRRYKQDVFQKLDRSFVTLKQLQRHCVKTIDGAYSMSPTDTVVIEEKLTIDPIFNAIGSVGLPDVRVIVVNFVPLLAMLRLPTKKSEGKGNLHAGALGFGVDLKTGQLFHGISENKTITLTSEMRNFEIPHWKKILEIAVHCQEASQIGYLGVDITIDADRGPIVLELNGHPGLEIQNANLAPLRSRVERIQHFKVKNVEEGVHLGQELFGQRSVDLKYITDDHVLGRTEEVQIVSQLGTIRTITAKIDPQIVHSQIEFELAKRLGYKTHMKHFDCKFYVKGNEITSKAESFQKDSTSKSQHLMIIGRKDLKGFFINPSKNVILKNTNTSKHIPDMRHVVVLSMREIDRILHEISNQIHIVDLLLPENLEKEKEVFLNSKNYNPYFRYKQLPFDVQAMKLRLQSLECDDSPIGIILEHKREELLDKLSFITSIGTEKFYEATQKLYGDIRAYDQNLFRKEAEDYLYSQSNREKKMKLTAVLDYVDTILEQYNLPLKVKVKADMIAHFSATKKGTLFVKEDIEISKKQLISTLAHEIETHILTAYNGKKQPYHIFTDGWGGYLSTQEGLAIYNQMKVENNTEVYKRMARDLEVLCVAAQSSFRDTFDYVLQYVNHPEDAWNVVLRMKRGVAHTELPQVITKRLVYYEGFHMVKKYLDNGGDIYKLYCGKIALSDIQHLDTLEDIDYSSIIIPSFWQ